jgi:hypothetical protein
MGSAKKNCQRDVQIKCINWRSQPGKLKRLPPMGLWIHAAPMHSKAVMHRTKPKDCVEMNAYFNDQSYEYQTRIIIMADNLYLHLKSWLCRFCWGQWRLSTKVPHSLV